MVKTAPVTVAGEPGLSEMLIGPAVVLPPVAPAVVGRMLPVHWIRYVPAAMMPSSVARLFPIGSVPPPPPPMGWGGGRGRRGGGCRNPAGPPGPSSEEPTPPPRAGRKPRDTDPGWSPPVPDG